MAEKPAAEKTEKPTPKRIEKARQRGVVPQSQEMSSVATLIVLIGMVALMGPELIEWLVIQIKSTFSGYNTSVLANPESFIKFINSKILGLITVICPILAVLVVGSILTNTAVSGLNFAPAAVKLKFDQINPVSGFGKLVNTNSMVKLLLSILKLLFVSLIVWFYLRDRLESLAVLRWAWSAELLTAIGRLILGLMIRIGIALLILGLADLAYRKWKYMHDLKMTRQEVKQERRDWEGSPEVKVRIRKIQFEMAMRRISAEVPKATVVLVNPTHVAVALKYEAKTMDAPVVVAKGADELAEKIREVARAYGVPVIRKPELARTIYSTVKAGHPVPEALYVAVAEVLAMIYRLRRKRQTAKNV